MSEALLWAPNELLPRGKGRDKSRSTSSVELSALPTVEPGQLWYVELLAKGALSPLEHRALTASNVVIYDRALAPIVARYLPIGGYAESTAPNDASSDAGWDRCIHFARDGWSVARFVDGSRRRFGNIPQLSRRLLRVRAPTGLPVSMFSKTGGRYEECRVDLDQLGSIIDARCFDEAATLIIIFAAIDAPAAPHFAAASSNGLAG
jgi:hypothetical protein